MASRPNPTAITVSRAAKTSPNLCHTSQLQQAAHGHGRVAAAGQRVARRPVRHGQHQVSVGDTGREQPGSLLVVGQPAHDRARPPRPRVWLRTGSVAATRTWLGAGSPSAAATNDGAAMAVPDSTVQSGNSLRMWSPSRRLKMASTRRSPGLSSCARSPACRLPTSSCQSTASARGRLHAGVGEDLAAELGTLQHPDPGSALICGPWFRSAGTAGSTVTRSPYREVSSSVMR